MNFLDYFLHKIKNTYILFCKQSVYFNEFRFIRTTTTRLLIDKLYGYSQQQIIILRAYCTIGPINKSIIFASITGIFESGK